MAECRSCGAAILWARTERDKPIPLDAEPDPAGRIVFVSGDTVRVLRKDEEPPSHALVPRKGQRYTSHFATCPNAEQHRRKS